MTRRICLLGFSIFFILVTTSAFAQDKYPTKPVNLYIGFPPGGGVDLMARAVGERMANILGQPFVPINKPGGGTTVEATLLSQAKPDGYTIGTLTTFAITLIPHLQKVPYKPLDDFEPIIEVNLHPLGLCIRPDSPWKTLKEFIDYAKNNPEKVSYSSAGAGSHQHIVMEWIAKKEGIRWKHVPYPGGPEATTAVLGGHVTATSGAATIVPVVREGRLRMLAVYGEKRMAEFPNVPTLRECGYDLAVEVATGFAGPKGIPEFILNRLETTFQKIIFEPEIAAVMKNMEMPVMYRNRRDFKKGLEDEYWQMKKLTRDLGLSKIGP